MYETETDIIAAPAAAPSPTTQPTDHVELLMLDEAVARVSERFLLTGGLNATQREVLTEYGEDVEHLMAHLRGPARVFAEQLGSLVESVLRASIGSAGPGDRARVYAA